MLDARNHPMSLLDLQHDAYRPELATAGAIEAHLVELDQAGYRDDPAVFGHARELLARLDDARRAHWSDRLDAAATALRTKQEADRRWAAELCYDKPKPKRQRRAAVSTSYNLHYTKYAPAPANNLESRSAALGAAGRRALYGYGHALVDSPAKADQVLIALGLQPCGRYLYMADLDSHTAGQDADAARAALEQALPHVASRMAWAPSRNGGHHAFFETHKRLPTGKLYADGQHIGELLGDGSHTADPGDLPISVLTLTQIEHLLGFWTVQGSDAGGERWSDRAKQGERWASGYPRIRVTRAQLRTFLQNETGRVGQHLDSLLDERNIDRSAAAGNLMQTLMLFAHKLPGLRNAPFMVKCPTVMAYWMTADSFGKAGEKDYNQEKDGYSLIAQIVNGDALDNGKRWTCPFWAKSQSPAAPNPVPDPMPPAQPEPRAAHRPSSQPKRLGRLRRALEGITPDDWGRRIYFLDELAGRLKVPRRTLQADLAALRTTGEISTAQVGGNGAPYAILMPCFGGARSTPKADKNPFLPATSRGASDMPRTGVLLPQNAESQPVCNKEEDHQNSSAPAGQPPAAVAARPAGAQGFGDPLPAPAGAPLSLEDVVARDLAIMQALYADLRPLTPEERAKSRTYRQKRFVPRRGQRIDQRYSLKNHGEVPAPAPYRPRAGLAIEDLPEPPQSQPCAPAGAAPAGLVERLHSLKAQREQEAL